MKAFTHKTFVKFSFCKLQMFFFSCQIFVDLKISNESHQITCDVFISHTTLFISLSDLCIRFPVKDIKSLPMFLFRAQQMFISLSDLYIRFPMKAIESLRMFSFCAQQMNAESHWFSWEVFSRWCSWQKKTGCKQSCWLSLYRLGHGTDQLL